ncbi:MAG: glycosyltransferase family 1 protein [Chitinophagaceae bacterium]
MADRIKVVFFQRKPFPIHKSVEFIFADVRNRMPLSVQCFTKVFRFYSKGVLQRLGIIWEAYRNQRDVNHITGDIHFSAILLAREKTMLTVLDCRMLSDSHGIKHKLFKYFWFTLPLKKCALVTVISEATKLELVKFTNYPEQQIRVIPVAISPEFKYSFKAFNAKRPVILQVGTMPHKNLERLIKALNGISCQLNVIGSLSEPIKELMLANNISYHNESGITQERLLEFYLSCDMISFVSTYEGFGMPIVEANAIGRPVITSKILSMPEVAADSACLVNPFDVEDIRAGIQKIIHDEAYRDELVSNGLENCKRFDPDKIAGCYLECYKKLSGKFVKTKEVVA